MKYISLIYTMFLLCVCSELQSAIISFDLGQHTIQKVRTAQLKTGEVIVCSDYDGMLLAVDYNGIVLWQTSLSNGTMNHDVWCADINGDGIDEILAANANGYLYCLDWKGSILWKFTPYEGYHQTPMYAVCVVKDRNHTPYVVCGDFSLNCYYLDAHGSLVKVLPSKSYSQLKTFGKVERTNAAYANFLRPIPQPDGSDLLLVHASNNHMQSIGEFYVMEPLEQSPVCRFVTDQPKGGTVGEVRVVDPDGDGLYEVLYGTSTLNSNMMGRITFSDDYHTASSLSYILPKQALGSTCYRVNQPFVLYGAHGFDYAVLSANRLLRYGSNGSTQLKESVSTLYAYYDVWVGKEGQLILASSQDGGSCIHVIDTRQDGWTQSFKNLEPQGKIAQIKDYTRRVRHQLAHFVPASYQREAVPVVGLEGDDLPIAAQLNKAKSLVLYASPWNKGRCQEPSWRSPLYDGNSYRDHRDRRNSYTLSKNDVFNWLATAYEGATGIAVWAGHGNDPLYYSLDVLQRAADYGYAHGKKPTIYIYPEMNHHDDDFTFLMSHHIYPLMEHLRGEGGKVALRPKNVFWQAQVYTPAWKRVLSGKLADVVVPLLEETTDKTQDLSLAGRLGLWTAGCVDAWGVRCSRDDPSFDRSRQFSSQKLSNHLFLKTLYSVALGASYIHNSYVDVENEKLEQHSSLVLELIAKQALYVPKRNEILSFSPIHISMTTPRSEYIDEGENHKWSILFDREREEKQPAVFSHMNASWMGASVTPWDFSAYASGVCDRRQNAIPFYPYGLVLITPVQEGALADTLAPRGRLVEHLHPFYKDKLKEYITDGMDYISADGIHHYPADSLYKNIQDDIIAASALLPVVVRGDAVGWVVAQMSPIHLRLTLVDSGYLNPKERHVEVAFHGIAPKVVTDVLDHTVFHIDADATMKVDVPCGMFRFIDIELDEPLTM